MDITTYEIATPCWFWNIKTINVCFGVSSWDKQSQTASAVVLMCIIVITFWFSIPVLHLNSALIAPRELITYRLERHLQQSFWIGNQGPWSESKHKYWYQTFFRAGFLFTIDVGIWGLWSQWTVASQLEASRSFQQQQTGCQGVFETSCYFWTEKRDNLTALLSSDPSQLIGGR